MHQAKPGIVCLAIRGRHAMSVQLAGHDLTVTSLNLKDKAAKYIVN